MEAIGFWSEYSAQGGEKADYCPSILSLSEAHWVDGAGRPGDRIEGHLLWADKSV